MISGIASAFIALALTSQQLKIVRHAYCRAEREQIAQGLADKLNGQPSYADNPNTLMLKVYTRALERVQGQLHLSLSDANDALAKMFERYPDIGNAESAIEISSACQEYGE